MQTLAINNAMARRTILRQSRSVRVDRYTQLAVEIIHSIPEKSGEKQLAILFVHGLGSNRSIWAETADWMCSSYGHVCILVDLRGHGDSAEAIAVDGPHDINPSHLRPGRPVSEGKSSIYDSNYSLSRSADDLAAVIRTFFTSKDEWWPAGATDVEACKNDRRTLNEMSTIDSVIAVGHSYGGNVVVELGLRHPSLLSDLILVDGGYIDLQGTFPDFSSCLSVLRPPSFTGMSASDLDQVVRTEWAVEGKAKPDVKLEITHENEIAHPEEFESDGAGRTADKAGSLNREGCWSEQAIQAVLKNFRIVYFDPFTPISGARGVNLMTEIISAQENRSRSRSNSSSINRKRSDSISSAKSDNSVDSSSTGESSIHRSRSQNRSSRRGACELTGGYSSTAISCVQTVLSFKRYLLLLEDLWRRRPCDQFKELAMCKSHASVSPSNPTRSLSSMDLERSALPSPSVATYNSSSSSNSKFVSSDGTVELNSVLFIPAGSPSPFSVDKSRDIALAIDATRQPAVTMPLSLLVPLANPQPAHKDWHENTPLAVPVPDNRRAGESESASKVTSKNNGNNEEQDIHIRHISDMDVDTGLGLGLSLVTLEDNHSDGDIPSAPPLPNLIAPMPTPTCTLAPCLRAPLSSSSLSLLCRVVSFPNSGHNIPLQAPRELGDVIQSHLISSHHVLVTNHC